MKGSSFSPLVSDLSMCLKVFARMQVSSFNKLLIQGGALALRGGALDLEGGALALSNHQTSWGPLAFGYPSLGNP